MSKLLFFDLETTGVKFWRNGIRSCTIRKMTKSNGAPRTDSLRNMPAVIGMDGDRLNGRVFQLSPLFVEEMMGYPLMWTTLPFLTGNGEKNQ